MKFKKVAVCVLAAASLMLSACGGGSGNTSVGGISYSHSQLAYDFVDTVNKYMANYDLELQKINTLQYNYIVVYDYVTGTYDAYDLSWYNPGENISNYLYNYDAYFYYNLAYEGGNVYYDPYTGTRFNRNEISLDSYMKKAMRSEAYKSHVAEAMKQSFGLSLHSAKDLAQAYIDMAAIPASQLSATFVDRVAQQAFGFSISKVESELAAGNVSAIDEALSSASVKTNMPAELLSSKIKQVFNLDLQAIKESL